MCASITYVYFSTGAWIAISAMGFFDLWTADFPILVVSQRSAAFVSTMFTFAMFIWGLVASVKVTEELL